MNYRDLINYFLLASLILVHIPLSVDTRFDDAYITYRVAWNVAQHGEMVYNLGERHLVTTSPVFTLAIAPLAKLFSLSSFPRAVILLNLFLAFVTAALVYKFVSVRRGRFEGVILSLPFSLMGHVFFFAGLETNLAILLAVAAIFLFANKRCLLSGVVVGVLFFTRGDYAVLFLVLIGTGTLAARHPVSRMTALLSLGAAIVVIPGCLAAYLYYGSPVPSTLGVKMFHGRQCMVSAPFVVTLIRSGPIMLSANAWLNFALLAATLVFAIRNGLVLMRDPQTFLDDRVFPACIVYFGLLDAFTLTVLGVDSAYPWYQVPLVTAIAVGSLAFLTDVCRQVKWPVSWVPRVVTVMFLVVLFVANRSAPYFVSSPPFSRSLGQAYIEIAQFLCANTKPGQVVALGECGMIGYYCQSMRVFDYFGVATPYFDLWSADRWNQQLVRKLRDVRPDFLVGWDRTTNMADYWFADQKAYELVKAFITNDENSLRIYLLRRRPL